MNEDQHRDLKPLRHALGDTDSELGYFVNERALCFFCSQAHVQSQFSQPPYQGRELQLTYTEGHYQWDGAEATLQQCLLGALLCKIVPQLHHGFRRSQAAGGRLQSAPSLCVTALLAATRTAPCFCKKLPRGKPR